MADAFDNPILTPSGPPQGTPATGFPSLEYGNTGVDEDGNQTNMPVRVIRDAFEVLWDRRTIEERRDGLSLVLSAGTSETLDISDLVPSLGDLLFDITFPNLSSTELPDGATVTLSLVAGALADLSDSVALYTRTVTGDGDKGANGWQTSVPNAGAYSYLGMTVAESGSDLGISSAYVDVIYRGQQRRKVKSIVGHIECNAASTVTQEFDDFIDQTKINSPRMYVARNTPADGTGMLQVRFSGDYFVDRITVDRTSGKASNVVLSLVQEGAWVDE